MQDKFIHHFDLSTIINPATVTKESPQGDPFGVQYSGQFTVRRPTLRDNANISLAFIRSTTSTGEITPELMATPAIAVRYIFVMMGVVATEVPTWFNEDGLHEEDEPAVLAVHDEVERWLATFRQKEA